MAQVLDPPPAPSRKAGRISTLLVLGHLLAVLLACGCLWWFGNWGRYAEGLVLTMRILAVVWFAHLLVTVLTRVTIFGWTFRRYFRPEEQAGPPVPPLRPTKAPWYKSGAQSFSVTLVLVTLTGLCALATGVMYVLVGVTGGWVFWLVFKIMWASWWVLVVATVVVRVSLFGATRKKPKQNDVPGNTGGEA